jgi:CRISPR-associated protein Cas5t
VYAFIVKGFSVTASFRIPESHTFQQTLPLPPVTTLTGLMGAAMGLDFKKVMEFREQRRILFGIIGSNKGEMKDLWKYNKMKTTYKPDGSDRKAVLIREYLTDFSLTVAIASEEQIILSEVRDSFCNPRYALTLGNSDDLFKIKYIGPVVEAKNVQCSVFENTILAGDQTLDYKPDFDLKNKPITYRVRAPQVFLLPTAFNFNGEERRVRERKQFTFVGSPIKLKNPISVHMVEDIKFPLL